MEPLLRVTAPTLDVVAALLAAEGPAWGLQLIKVIGRPSGTVYPILERLERQGWIDSSWDDDAERSGPRRRLYEFTADGRQAAAELIDARRAADAAAARPAARPSSRPVTS
ncbi:PadR family transcriptional regulator [Curtobacterium sp. MCBD17_021]|uniref:PadR family transcriptional regulator n=1 Tax=Curtobacterium sp. MCBD17_021 TaxID=2175665 RepID=UPI000DA7CBC7|nr:PadR family transcriptional regulator [Curtobacterium sp. MCBD17_021]PZE66453.1 PadR family transcriptional regulator [Curtobacterium sp. MCBD17_021]